MCMHNQTQQCICFWYSNGIIPIFQFWIFFRALPLSPVSRAHCFTSAIDWAPPVEFKGIKCQNETHVLTLLFMLAHFLLSCRFLIYSSLIFFLFLLLLYAVEHILHFLWIHSCNKFKWGAQGECRWGKKSRERWSRETIST